jgi:uncharacterized protein YbaR (Trm112 family)
MDDTRVQHALTETRRLIATLEGTDKPQETMYCRTCGKAYSDGSTVCYGGEFCAAMGLPLISEAERGRLLDVSRKAKLMEHGGKMCLKCHRVYPASEAYCVVDGDRLFSMKKIADMLGALTFWERVKGTLQWMAAIAVLLGIIGLLWFGITQLL